MRLALALVTVAMIVLAACGGDDGEPSPTATRDASSVSLPLPDPESGAVRLAAGNYHTTRLSPSAFFAVGENWSVQYDAEWLLDLSRGAESEPHTLSIVVPDGVVEEDGLLTYISTPQQLEAWIVSDSRFVTSSPSSLQIGNLPARQLQLTLAEDVAPMEGLPPGEGIRYLYWDVESLGILNGYRQHLIIVDFRGKALVIIISAPEEDFGPFFSVVEPIVGTLAFTD